MKFADGLFSKFSQGIMERLNGTWGTIGRYGFYGSYDNCGNLGDIKQMNHQVVIIQIAEASSEDLQSGTSLNGNGGGPPSAMSNMMRTSYLLGASINDNCFNGPMPDYQEGLYRSYSSSRLNDINVPGMNFNGYDQTGTGNDRHCSPPIAGYHRRLPMTPAGCRLDSSSGTLNDSTSVIVGQIYQSNPHIDVTAGQWRNQPTQGLHRRLPATPAGQLLTQQYQGYTGGSMQHLNCEGLGGTGYMNYSTHNVAYMGGTSQGNSSGSLNQPERPDSTPPVNNESQLPKAPGASLTTTSTGTGNGFLSQSAAETPPRSILHQSATTTVITSTTRPRATSSSAGRPALKQQPATTTNGHQHQVNGHHRPAAAAMNQLSSEYSLDNPSVAGTSSSNAESQLSSLSPSIERLAVSSPDQQPKLQKIDDNAENDTEDDGIFNLDDFIKHGAIHGDPTHSRNVSPLPNAEELSPAKLNKVHTVTGVGACGCGSVDFSVQYFPVRKRLRVNVMKAEDIGAQLQDKKELQIFVRIRLMPGKIQQQQSDPVTFQKTVRFAEEFFFENVSPQMCDECTLHLQICYEAAKKTETLAHPEKPEKSHHHHNDKVEKAQVLGTIALPLNLVPDLASKREIKLHEEMRPKMGKKLGKLSFTTQLEKSSKRLTVNVVRADDLPKFNGKSPDPLVRITVEQNGKTQTKQTRALKHSCNGVWKEAVMFLMNTKDSDLKSTAITVAVHDKQRTASGFDLIGCVYLGSLAKDKTEIDMWKGTINSSREQKGIHVLKFPGAELDEDD